MNTMHLAAAQIVPTMLDLIKNYGGTVVEHTDSRIVVQTSKPFQGSDRHILLTK